MFGHPASLLFALATMGLSADKEVTSVSSRQLNVGQKFEIRTDDCVYRGQMVDRTSGQCLLTTSPDGTHFTAPRTVYLLGATAGQQDRQSLVLMHEVKVGLKMELGLDDLAEKNRQITGEVRTIRLGL
jgi:hypothetical protein